MLVPLLREILATFPVVAIMESRQAGTPTLILYPVIACDRRNPMMEIQALLPLAETPAKLFHVRTHDGLEVDGLLEIGQRHLPLEIKASRTVTASDAAPIERWIGLNPTHGPGVVLYLGDEYLALSAKVRAVPAWALFGAP